EERMSPLICRWLALSFLLSLTGVVSAGEAVQRLDAHGDPLPDGALARHGSVRLRHNGDIALLAFPPDGKSILSLGTDSTFRRWDLATGREQWRFEKKGLVQIGSNRMDLERMLIMQQFGGGKRMVMRELYGGEGSGFMVSHSADGKILAMV